MFFSLKNCKINNKISLAGLQTNTSTLQKRSNHERFTSLLKKGKNSSSNESNNSLLLAEKSKRLDENYFLSQSNIYTLVCYDPEKTCFSEGDLFKIKKHNDEEQKALRMDIELGYFSDSLLGKKDNDFDLKGNQNG